MRADRARNSFDPHGASPGKVSENEGEAAFEHGQSEFCPPYGRARRDLSAICKNLAEEAEIS
jgi:hypothetical protein